MVTYYWDVQLEMLYYTYLPTDPHVVYFEPRLDMLLIYYLQFPNNLRKRK